MVDWSGVSVFICVDISHLETTFVYKIGLLGHLGPNLSYGAFKTFSMCFNSSSLTL